MANAPLARMFEYNAWANVRVIEACRDLTDAQLDAPGSHVFGSIRETLLHAVYGQYSFLARLGGAAQDPRAVSPQWAGFDALVSVAAETSDALITEADALVDDAYVVLAFQGKSYRYPKSFFLMHAIQHGIEHRTQIGTTLAQLGREAPNLDSWAFAVHLGLGEEV